VTERPASGTGTPQMTAPVEAIPDAATYNSFIAALQLRGIELVKIHGERTALGTASQSRFDLAAGYMQDSGAIHYRYDVMVHFLDDAGTSLGNASASVLLITSAAGAQDMACIERFGASSGALMAHPYLREAIASTAQRIGFPGVLLPMIKYQPDKLSED
jgi:hypothetical protein